MLDAAEPTVDIQINVNMWMWRADKTNVCILSDQELLECFVTATSEERKLSQHETREAGSKVS